jgi:hypothetical protein
MKPPGWRGDSPRRLKFKTEVTWIKCLRTELKLFVSIEVRIFFDFILHPCILLTFSKKPPTVKPVLRCCRRASNRCLAWESPLSSSPVQAFQPAHPIGPRSKPAHRSAAILHSFWPPSTQCPSSTPPAPPTRPASSRAPWSSASSGPSTQPMLWLPPLPDALHFSPWNWFHASAASRLQCAGAMTLGIWKLLAESITNICIG